MRAGLNHNLPITSSHIFVFVFVFVFVYLYLSDSGLLLAEDCVQGIYMRETTLQDIDIHCPAKLPSLYIELLENRYPRKIYQG